MPMRTHNDGGSGPSELRSQIRSGSTEPAGGVRVADRSSWRCRAASIRVTTSPRSVRHSATRNRCSALDSRRASRPDATTKTKLNSTNTTEAIDRVATQSAPPMSNGTIAESTGKPGTRVLPGGVGSTIAVGPGDSVNAFGVECSTTPPWERGARSTPSRRTANTWSWIVTRSPGPRRAFPSRGSPLTFTGAPATARIVR